MRADMSFGGKWANASRTKECGDTDLQIMGKLAVCVAILFALASCNETARISPELTDRVTSDVRKAFAGPRGPGTINLIAAWHAGADATAPLICGEIEAPPQLRKYRSTLRFVDDLTGGYAQVEYHELWAGGAIGTKIVDANRALFNDLWVEHCEAYRP
ncbi:hypothetical protein [Sphingobium abikonense]|uniref:hypothetical protein n=1 Tax=Sphingobium abikonense TaxID=86193 RepID=UPI0035155FDB